jgi:hypothetical protein
VLDDGTEQTFDPASAGSAPSPIAVDNLAGFAAVSCPSAGQCTAMDDRGDEVTFDPTTGTLIGAQVPFQMPVPTDRVFYAISCPTTSQCTVVDGSDQAVTFNPQLPVFPVSPTIDPGAKIDDVSCATASDCVVVDDVGQALEGDPTETGPWTFEQVDPGDMLTAVDCSSASQCVAVDQDGNAFVGQPGGSAPPPSSPAVVTGQASAITSTAATVSATVNPDGGAVTDCELQYGTDTSYQSDVPMPCTTLPGAGTTPVDVSVHLSGLVSGATYQYRFVAQNAGGRSYGANMSFTTLPGPRAPMVSTGGPVSVRTHQAVVAGSINPEGAPLSDCELHWGTDATYENVPMPCEGAIGTGHVAAAVRGSLIGLSPSTTYHYRFVAQNEVARVYGADRTFTTPPGRKAARETVLLSGVPPARHAHVTNVLSVAIRRTTQLRLYAYTIGRRPLAGLELRINSGARTVIRRTGRAGIATYRVPAAPARAIMVTYAGNRRYAPARLKIHVRRR